MSRRAAGVTGAVLVVVLVVLGWAATRQDLLPGAHPAVDVARDFSRAQVEREVGYHDAIRPAAYASLILGLVVAGGLGLTHAGAWIVGRCGRRWWVQVLAGTVAVTAIGRLVTLPLGLRTEAVRRDHGLSTRTWGAYSEDLAKAALVDAVVSALVLLAVVAIVRRVPRHWWLWGAGTVAGLVAVGSFLYPVAVEPLFNSFDSLPAGELRTDLLELARTEGVPVDDILVADASRRTTATNAYVSGLGSTRRVVLYDTLLGSATPREIEVLVAHELGHVREDDVLRGTVLGMLGGAAGVCVLALLVTWKPLLRRSGASGPGDPRIVPLVLFLVAAGSLLTAPAVNEVSRHVEQRADLRALEATRDPDTLICSLRHLALTNLGDLDPNPVAEWIFATHPSEPKRIAFARAWAAQHGIRTPAGAPACATP
jgi:STE24 endopeptidase